MGGIPRANNKVYAAAIDYWGNFYIGGSFSVVGETIANGIARWDGHQWSAVGDGIAGTVYVLAFTGSNVYVAGAIYVAGSTVATSIVHWEWNKWSALGSGIPVNSYSPPLFRGSATNC